MTDRQQAAFAPFQTYADICRPADKLSVSYANRGLGRRFTKRRDNRPEVLAD